MEIQLQLLSILISFFFGIFFSILTNLNYRYLFSKHIWFKTTFTVIYILDMALLYFLVMKMLNNGIIHSYFLLFVGLGFLFSFIKLSRYINRFKTWIKKYRKSVKK